MRAILENIEQNSDQKLWGIAEELYENPDIIQKVRPISRTLWHLEMQVEDKKLEVEVYLKAPKPKFTCECHKFLIDGDCEHIIVALLRIRDLELEKEAKAKKQKIKNEAQKAERAKYNVNSILDKSHPEELKRFVKTFASKDPSFLLALKVHFANKIDLENNDKKYKNLLDAAIKPKNYKHPNLTTKEKRDFYRLAESLANQIEDCIILKQYREAKYISFHVLDKISYIKKNYKFTPTRLLPVETDFIESIKSLYEKNIAPELRLELNKGVYTLLTRSYYSPGEVNLIRSIRKDFSLSSEECAAIIEAYAPIIESKEPERVNYLLCLMYLRNLEPKLIDEFLDSLKIDAISEALQKLYQLEETTLFHELVKDLKAKDRLSKNSIILSVKLHLFDEDFKKAFSFMELMVEKFQDYSMITNLIVLASPSFSNDEIKKLDKLYKNAPTKDKLNLLEVTDRIKELAETIKEEKDLNLSFDYLDSLSELDEDILYDLYLELVQNHLTTHIGNSSKLAIEETNRRLKNAGFTNLSRKLTTTIKKEFKHRKILADLN